MAKIVADEGESNKRLEKVERLKKVWKKKHEWRYYSRMVHKLN